MRSVMFIRKKKTPEKWEGYGVRGEMQSLVNHDQRLEVVIISIILL